MKSAALSMHYDLIIVGGGSSGAVLAARLSEDPHLRVLLLEAGDDHPDPASLPAELRSAHEPVTQGHNWALSAQLRDQDLLGLLGDAHGVFAGASMASRFSLAKTALGSLASGRASLTRFDYPMGRVMGGSSAVNGALAMRGQPDDYDEWARLGNPDWSWPQVLDCFRHMEADEDMRGPYHGSSGPVPVSRTPQAALHPVQRDFVQACRDLGFPNGDPNNPNATGCGRVPRNVKNGMRVSAATAYLSTARARSNLTIRPRSLVDRILFQGHRAVGVSAWTSAGDCEAYAADRIVVSAGALQTPALLMRSGIGPAAQLSALDIPIVADVPGVGRNLIDHPAVGLWMVPRAGICRAGEDIHQAMLRTSSSLGPQRNDLQLYMLNSVRTAQFQELQTALGTPLATALSAVLAKPDSRGCVELFSTDARQAPSITLNLATESGDMLRLMEGVRLAWQILHTPPLNAHHEKLFAWNARIVDNDVFLRQAISTFVRGSWHPVGTARMGPSSDAMAVVDQHGSVHACTGLTVADASIMPTIPSAPTNLSCMMIGERVSRSLRESAHV